jgi:hypothetical protein
MVLQFVRALWGGVLLVAPRALLDCGGRPSRGVTRMTRVLGARHLVEAVILYRRRPPPRWAVIVDATHGASMVVLAACSRRVRRAALASAAAAWLLAGWTELNRRRA